MGAISTARRILQRGTLRAPEPTDPPRLSGEMPIVGHLGEFVQNPFALLSRARDAGPLTAFRLAPQDVVLVTGPEAQEAFFRAPDDQLCRREAYKLMTPIFGEGVVFDAPGPRLNEQMRFVMQLLRDKRMRGYPPIVEDETLRLLQPLGDRGELDLLEFMKDVTMYASSRCLIGDEFRGGMSDEFHALYGHLEEGIHPLAFIYPNAPLPRFRRRDQARKRLVARVDAIIEGRKRCGARPDDGLQALLDARYKDGGRLDAHEITGVLIAIMMAGHHTSAGTAAWTILELLRRPEYLQKVRQEIAAVHKEHGGLTYQGLRQMRFLQDVIKEVLRLHPPLIFLFRKVLKPWSWGGYTVPAGSMLCSSPGVSHRMASTFPNPEVFDPGRYSRGEDKNPFAWIAFGAGKHKCTGNAFGLLQLKAITATLLHHYDFELAQPDHTYRDDYEGATVMPKLPVRVRYRRRDPIAVDVAETAKSQRLFDPARPMHLSTDLQLCQGHAVCVSEAPEVFRIDDNGDVELLHTEISPDDADLHARVEGAYQHCPNRTIAIAQPEAKP